MKKKLATVMAATMAVSGSVVSVSAATTEDKIVGSNRTDTAVRISKEGWKSAETVILVNDSAIPDALTATPLAHAKNAPILLTGKDGLNKATADEIKRLGAKDVIMIGGDAVLPAKVEKDLKALNVKVDRIKGETREETALAIAKRLDGIKDVSAIAVVNGTTGLADAVSVAAAAAEKGMPILLANPKKGLSAAEKFIKDEAIKASFIIGGTTALPEKLVSSLPGKQRIEGLNRNDTNAKVIEKFYGDKELDNLYLAKDGRDGDTQLIDALAVGALAAKNGAPVLIASKKLSSAQVDVINTKKIDTITQVGGKGNEGAFNQLKDIEKEDVYEVGTVEELKEALANANANDKIVLKPNATITEDIIISTDKNVDIKVEGTVTGKVEITAPNGSVANNSTSKPSTGGGSGSIVNPPADNTPDTGAVLNGEKYTDISKAIADAKDGETVTIYGTNTINSKIEIKNKIKIVGKKNAILNASDDLRYSENLVTIMSDDVEISDISVSGGKYAIHAYGVKGVKLTNVKITDGYYGGLLVNSSEVKADGIKTTTEDTYYGIDVDEKISGKTSKLTLTNSEINEPIQVYAEKGTVEWATTNTYKEIEDGAVKGSIYSNRSEEIFTQGVLIGENYYKDIVEGIEASKDNETAYVYGCNELEMEALTINKPLTIIGKNNGEIAAVKEGWEAKEKNLITVLGLDAGEKVVMKNLTIRTSENYGLHLFKSDAELQNVEVKYCAGAGIFVNGGTLTGSNITTIENIWGGINIDQGEKVTTPSKIDITNYESKEEDHAIYHDKANIVDGNIVVNATNNAGKKYEQSPFIDELNRNMIEWKIK